MNSNSSSINMHTTTTDNQEPIMNNNFNLTHIQNICTDIVRHGLTSANMDALYCATEDARSTYKAEYIHACLTTAKLDHAGVCSRIERLAEAYWCGDVEAWICWANVAAGTWICDEEFAAMAKEDRITELQDSITDIKKHLATITNLDERDTLVHVQCELLDELEGLGVDISEHCTAWKNA